MDFCGFFQPLQTDGADFQITETTHIELVVDAIDLFDQTLENRGRYVHAQIGDALRQFGGGHGS